jgi:exodeoxyribonuclease V beta subunit
LAEDLRLAYVALTRARHRCYVVWGKCNGLQATGLGWLLHGRHVDSPRPLPGLQALFKERSASELRRDLESLAEQQPGAILVEPLPHAGVAVMPPATAQTQALLARRLGREMRHGWRVSSFSWLAGQEAPGRERPDYDAEPVEVAEPVEASGIFAFPRGGRPGVCLHSIFEQWDFTDPDAGRLHDLVGSKLRRYGFAADWTETVAEMVRAVLATSLDGRDLRLGELPRARRIDELEFHYPLARLDGGTLAHLLREHGFLPQIALQERLGRLQFALGEGFMKCFIDLVFEHDGRFYLADYKSNWLGPTLADYSAEKLAAAMGEQGYYLQYLIYALALHRYLQQRLPDYDYERHFGGVYYLFLRGMSPEQGMRSGVFHDRPPASLIEALDRYLRTGTIKETADAV